MNSLSNNYYELRLSLKGFDTDLLSGSLYNHGVLGIYEAEEDAWIIYLPGDWAPEHVKNLYAALQQLNPGFEAEQARIEKLPYRDWNKEWRKYFKPCAVVDQVWIRPPWETLPEQATGEDIVIDPQMAFGTGHHESTKLMIEAMLRFSYKNAHVLDLGTGSGILAILAKKLGATKVTGVDIDEDAIVNARHNIALNKMEDIQVQTGDVATVTNKLFSFILANIYFDVLFSLPLQLYYLLEPGGKLIISGILREDVSRICYVYKSAGLVEVDRLF
ncbi:MAG: 50S ribosomal protein L11 methyltransferase, partial [Aliifodinibius sp.]|nr:50S ribosomal protein L11 methyltransferase [Fodinibius sp.]